jgi:hypothetical protein
MSNDTIATRDETEIQVLEGTAAIAAFNRAEIDVQISTAKRYPRSISAFIKQATEMATLDEDTASSMFYALPRAGKTIEGPSVRLAEIVGSAWGNIRYGARIVEVTDKHIVAQGMAFDLEKNIACAIEVRRRITDKYHRRYDEDMIGVTGNAASSIALRNAIFKVIPFAYVKSVYDSARAASIGKAQTMEQRRTRALDRFAKLGAPTDVVLKILQRPDVADISVDDLVTLHGLLTAIKDGEITLEQALKEAGVTPGGKLEKLLDKLKPVPEPTAPREADPPAAEQASNADAVQPGSDPPVTAAAAPAPPRDETERAPLLARLAAAFHILKLEGDSKRHQREHLWGRHCRGYTEENVPLVDLAALLAEVEPLAAKKTAK